MRNNRMGFTITSMLVATGIIASFMVISLMTYQKNRSESNRLLQSQVFIYIQSLMNQIYQEQNPNAWPPESVMPNQISTWVMPTNLQNSGELWDTIMQYCKTFNGKPDFHGNGNFTCTYKLLVANSGTSESGNTTPPPPPNSGGHGHGPPPNNNLGGESLTITEDNYSILFDAADSAFCVSKRYISHKRKQGQVNQGMSSTNCINDPEFINIYECSLVQVNQNMNSGDIIRIG